MTVTAVFADTSTGLTGSPYLVSGTDFAANVTATLDRVVLVTAAPDADLTATRGAITTALAAYPNVTISDPAQLTRAAQDSTDQLLGLVTALLLLAVVGRHQIDTLELSRVAATLTRRSPRCACTAPPPPDGGPTTTTGRNDRLATGIRVVDCAHGRPPVVRRPGGRSHGHVRGGGGGPGGAGGAG